MIVNLILFNILYASIHSDTSEIQDIVEEDIIEEYLDEYLDEIKSENAYNIYADHKYTIIEENVIDDEDGSSINFEDTFEPDVKNPNSNSKKQYHKFHQLTGLFLLFFI